MRVKRVYLIALILVGLLPGARAVVQYWDSSNAAGYQHGNGVWSTADANWRATATSASASVWTNNNQAYFSATVGSSLITLGSAVTTTGLVMNGSGYTLEINNGGVLSNSLVNTTVSVSNNTILVSGGAGVTSLWNNGNMTLTLGYVSSTNNTLIIDGKGVPGSAIVTNIGLLTIGYATALGQQAVNNAVVVTNGGVLYLGAGNNYGQATVVPGHGIGVARGNVNSSQSNSLVIAAGGRVYANGSLFVGFNDYNAILTGNRLEVRDAGSLLDMRGNPIYAPFSYAAGQVITSGVAVVIDGGTVTNVGAFNMPYRTGGNPPNNNWLSVTNGGTLYTTNTCSIGYTMGTNNVATIDGDGSLWDMRGSILYVGNTIYSNNSLTIDHGGSLANVGTLLVHTNNVLALRGGSLSVSNVTWNTNALFTVGDGVQAATLEARGGALNFQNGLLVSSNAWLTGLGTVSGGVYGVVMTNGASLAAGGTNSVAVLTLRSRSTWHGGMALYAEVTNVAGAAGSGYDTITFSNAPFTVSANGGKIRIVLDSKGTDAGFSSLTSYALRLVQFTTGTSISADDFEVDATGFTVGGTWTLETTPTDLRYVYRSPVSSLYVSPTGNNSGGTNWVTAFTNIQAALTAAQMHGTIYLAGTLPITSQISWTNGIAQNLTIRGGYAANVGDPVLPGSNSPSLWPTVITRATGYTNRIFNITGITNGILDQTTISGGFADANGAGLFISGCTNLTIQNCVITNNQNGLTQGTRLGGGLYSELSSVILSNCVVRGNSCQAVQNGYARGGGIHLNSGTMTCLDSDISFNLVFGGNTGYGCIGGGIYAPGGTMNLKNCRLVGNSTLPNVVQTGALNGNLQMVNCTVASSANGGIRGIAPASMTNCIVWNNQDDIIGSVNLAYSNISDGDSNEVNGCISANPLFEYGSYLAGGSPCRDAGTGTAASWGLGSPYTTQTDGSPDSDPVDMGYHYPAGRDPVANADLYVSANIGDDSFAGTNGAAPFKTITKALAQAGDVRRIHVAEGNYTDNLETFPLNLTRRSWIEVLGTNSSMTVIDANAAGKTNRVFFIDNVAQARFTGMTIKGGKQAGVLASSVGGGILLNRSGDFTFSSCIITGNRSAQGAGIYASYSGLLLENSHLITNSALPFTVNTVANGGGLYALQGWTTISNCIIRANSAVGNNGYNGIGGGIYLVSGSLTLLQSVLTTNIASTTGGALYGAGRVHIQNCVISTNRATTNGDGIYFASGTNTIQNCTVAGNTGKGVHIQAGALTYATNSIFWGNGDDILGTMSVAYSDIGTADSFWTNEVNGCISTDPLFVDTTYFHLQSKSGNYLGGFFSGGTWGPSANNSPCIDTGYPDPAEPWRDVEPEPNGKRSNMGAYGNTAVASKGPATGGTVIRFR